MFCAQHSRHNARQFLGAIHPHITAFWSVCKQKHKQLSIQAERTLSNIEGKFGCIYKYISLQTDSSNNFSVCRFFTFHIVYTFSLAMLAYLLSL